MSLPSNYKPAGYSWPLRGIYALLFLSTNIALRVYYRRVTVVGRENMPDSGATILISNHPNTLLDPLQVASRIKRQVFFLANAGLFKNKFLGPLLRTFYCIPIERPQDVEGRAINNEQNFQECYLHLVNNGVIYIAPEGVSVQARTRLPLKTGTARIALGCVAHFEGKTDVKIVPVGLHYSSPLQFRSDVIIRIGTPISTVDWLQANQASPKAQHSRILTHTLQQHLEALKITAKDNEEESALSVLETIAHNDLPLTHLEEDQRSRMILKKIQNLEPDEHAALLKMTGDYTAALNQYRKSDYELFGKKSWWHLSGIVLLAPLALWGLINNLPAFGIPYLLRKVSNVHESYNATVQFLAGLFTVPIFYILQSYALAPYLPGLTPWIYGITLPVFGWIGWEWYLLLSKNTFTSTRGIDMEKLRAMRNAIKTQLPGGSL